MEKYLTDKNIFQYKTINPEIIPFSQDVVDACKANLCGRYGICWTCPPGVGEWQELEKKIKSYKNALVFTCKYELEDSFDYESMVEGMQKTRDIFFEICERVRKDGIDYMALGCEGCSLCEKCTFPDAPCRFPEKAVPSVEACGISVVELSKKIGINYSNGSNTVTYFCILLTR